MFLELAVEERERYANEGFFVRESVFGPQDLVSFRAAAERVAQAAEHAALEKAMAIAAATAADVDDDHGVAPGRLAPALAPAPVPRRRDECAC